MSASITNCNSYENTQNCRVREATCLKWAGHMSHTRIPPKNNEEQMLGWVDQEPAAGRTTYGETLSLLKELAVGDGDCGGGQGSAPRGSKELKIYFTLKHNSLFTKVKSYTLTLILLTTIDNYIVFTLIKCNLSTVHY